MVIFEYQTKSKVLVTAKMELLRPAKSIDDEYFLKQSGIQGCRLLLMIVLCYSHLRNDQIALSQPCTGKRQNVVNKKKSQKINYYTLACQFKSRFSELKRSSIS